MYSPLSVRSPRGGGTLQAPYLPSAQACPKKMRAHQGNHTGKDEKEKQPVPLLLISGCHERGAWVGTVVAPPRRPIHLRPPAPLPPPPALPPAPGAPGAHPLTPRFRRCLLLPAAAPAFPRPWTIGSPAPPARISHRPAGPGPSTCSSTSWSTSALPPT